MLVCYVLMLLCKYLGRSINTADTTSEMTVKLAMDIVISALVLVVDATLENSQRSDFEEYVKAYRSKQQAIKQKEATDAYLSQLLPLHTVLAAAVTGALRGQLARR